MRTTVPFSLDAELDSLVERLRRLTLNDPSILDLNYDVLQYLLRHMGPTRDTLHFAMTSRAAYKFAIPQYLSRVVLDCRSRGRPFARHRAAGFCKFILADDVRSRALRELVILGTAVDIVALDWEARDHYDVLQGLGLVFTKAHLLRSLSLSHSASLFSAMPWLPDLIAGLTHLRMLRLGCALAENVSGLLAQAQKSCRVLSRASLQLFVHRFMDISKDLGPAVYPIVDTLFVYGELHGLESIADKFPNIETLYLLPDSDFIANQHAHSVPEDKWTRLDYVSTVTPLPRMRTVRHLRIDYLINPGDGDMNRLRTTGDRTASMIRAMRPVVVDCFMSDTVLRLLGEHATDLTVIRLRIKNTTSGKADKADLETMTNGITARLVSLPLRGLMLIGDAPFPRESLKKFAERLCTHFKQLEYIGLVSASPNGRILCRSNRCIWFRVNRRPGRAPVVKVLTQEEGQNAYDELVALQRP